MRLKKLLVSPPEFKTHGVFAPNYLSPVRQGCATCSRTQKHTCAAPHNHDTFHFDWQELLPGIKARYYLSCPVRQGLTGVTFSVERQAARVYITPPAASSLPALTAVCLSACLQRLSVPFHVCHTLCARRNESAQTRQGAPSWGVLQFVHVKRTPLLLL